MKRSFYAWIPALALAFSASPALAQYETTGPDGGEAYTFFRETSGDIYVAGSGGVFRTNDEGKSWRALTNMPAAFSCDKLYSISVSGPDIYAGSDRAGIYISHDGGANWTSSRSGLDVVPGVAFADIEIAGPNVLAIRRDSGYLYLSQDQGANWGRINPSLPGAKAQYLSSYNGNVFVSTPQGLYRSMDNGQSFMNINPLPANFGKLVWVGDTAYAATASGIKMSLDQGMSFSTVALSGRAVRDVAVANNRMYAIVRGIAPTQDSVLVSTDGGQNFSAVPFNGTSFRFTQINDVVATSQGLLVGSDYSIYGTADSGANWSDYDSGFRASPVSGLAISGGYLIAGVSPMGLFRAVPDSGALAWQHTGSVANNIGTSIQTVAAHGAIVHAGGASGYYRSADSGLTWTVGTAGATGGNVKSIWASAGSADVWLIRNGDLYYSADDGATFGTVVNSQIPAGLSERVMKADTALFVSTFGALYKGGSTMSFAATSGISGFVNSVVHLGNTFYAATNSSGLFTSNDGSSWTAYTVVAPGTLPSKINALILDSAGTGLIAGTDNGIYSNSTGGVWQQDALASHVVNAMAMRNGKIFAGTCSGVYSIPYKLIPPETSVRTQAKGNIALQVVPNPNQGDFLLRMQSSKAGQAELSVRDVMGRMVYHRSVMLQAGTNEIKVANQGAFAPGIYVAQLVSEGVSGAVRVVVR
jgi:photosystem II stability/assembly factor-like uncharacterized protein